MNSVKQAILFLIGLTLAVKSSYSQPGGGGGLNISYIKYVNGDTLDFTDKNFKINHYVMNKKFSKVEYEFTELQTTKRSYSTGEKNWFYLPPDYYDNKFQVCRNQRLEIIYKIDTMTIDFFGVMQENGIGRTEQLNMIEFFPGHYKFHLTESERFDSCWQLRNQFPDQIDKLQEDMRKGIIQSTRLFLNGWRILEGDFDKYREIFWARYFRETCEEIIEQLPANVTRLCEYMIELTETNFYLTTAQNPSLISDTTIYRYHFYYNFFTQPVISVNDGKQPTTIHPHEENQLAKKYLAAIESHTLYVNGSKYTGKIELRVNYQNYGIGYLNQVSEIHNYYFEDGKLNYKNKITTNHTSSSPID